MTTQETLTLTPREGGSSSFWIKGSRERYGEAYFVGSDLSLWKNRRPYGVNFLVGTMPDKDVWTWQDVGEVINSAKESM